ncbi:MAG: WhiB family transcriptional regulator [Actinomycetota bacterium]|nr:WhiB family transcriptional regulator [Actinomycetota bacterium]
MRTISSFPAPALRSYAWQQDGLCRGMSSERFFTEDQEQGQQRRSSRTREAKQLCSQCPVVQLCLTHALAIPETYGIWGGTTAAERTHLVLRATG